MNITKFIDYRKICPFCNQPLKLNLYSSNAVSNVVIDNNLLSFQTIIREWPLSFQSFKHVWRNHVNLNTGNIEIDYIDVTTKIPLETIPVTAIKKYIECNKMYQTNYECDTAKCNRYKLDGFLRFDLNASKANIYLPIECFNVSYDLGAKYSIANNIYNETSCISINNEEPIHFNNYHWKPEEINKPEFKNRLGMLHLFS